MEITEADREKLLQPNNAGYLGGRSLIMLSKFWPLLTTYLPHVDIGEIIPLLFQGEICQMLTFPVPPTHHVFSM